jgi:phospholipase/carboxylesterase
VRSLALALALLGCTKREVPSPPQPPSLVRLELVTGGASAEEALPIIVALHGLGDRPEAFARVFDDLPLRARVVIPRAPLAYEGGGFAWFHARTREGDPERISQELTAAAEMVDRLLAELVQQHEQRVVLTGFSQGGMLSFAVAAKHPDRIAAAVPIAGWLPSHLLPAGRPARAPLVRAMHGSADPLVPLSLDRETCDRLKELGYDVELLTFEGIDHSLSLEMHRVWMQLLVKLAAG